MRVYVCAETCVYAYIWLQWTQYARATPVLAFTLLCASPILSHAHTQTLRLMCPPEGPAQIWCNEASNLVAADYPLSHRPTMTGACGR